jgi:hypothetical protein
MSHLGSYRPRGLVENEDRPPSHLKSNPLPRLILREFTTVLVTLEFAYFLQVDKASQI